MRSSVQALWTLYVLLSSFFSVACAFKNFSASAISFSTLGGFESLGWFMCDVDQQHHVVQTTTTLGATASASFRGTAVYLLALVDVDRAVLEVTVDNEPPVDVIGSFSSRECRFIFSRQNLPYGKHSISARVKGPNPTGATKFELASFVYTAPDDADIAALQAAAAQSSSASIPRPSSSAKTTANTAAVLDGASIAGIVAGCFGLIALAAAIIFYYIHRQRLRRLKDEDLRAEQAELTGSPSMGALPSTHQSPVWGTSNSPFNRDVVPTMGRTTPSNAVSYTLPTQPQPAAMGGPYPLMSQYPEVYPGRRI